jgi:hypothetical protein
MKNRPKGVQLRPIEFKPKLAPREQVSIGESIPGTLQDQFNAITWGPLDAPQAAGDGYSFNETKLPEKDEEKQK